MFAISGFLFVAVWNISIIIFVLKNIEKRYILVLTINIFKGDLMRWNKEVT
jgi:hypothetical protein